MQAPLSYTASGEQFLTGHPSPLPPPLSHVFSSSRQSPFGGPVNEERAHSVLSIEGVAESVAEGVGLAHDAGNLLGAIRLYCDLLSLPGVLRTEHRHYAEELRQLSARSRVLIDRLLTGRRPALPAPDEVPFGTEAQRTLETIRPAEVVAACRGLLQTIVGAGALLISVEAGAEASGVSGGEAEIAVPREAMERILVNLTKNAVEAGADGASGTIVLRVRSVVSWGQHGGIALSVEDHGRGMSEAMVRRLLSGATADALHGKQARPWRGIGFQVVRELVAETGGELRIRSRQGQGTTVEIVWARTPADGTESG